MCKCTPEMRMPWCGKPGCEAPPPRPSAIRSWTTYHGWCGTHGAYQSAHPGCPLCAILAWRDAEGRRAVILDMGPPPGPPPVCTGSGTVPADFSINPMTDGRCGICGQRVPLISYSLGQVLATHPYRTWSDPEYRRTT